MAFRHAGVCQLDGGLLVSSDDRNGLIDSPDGVCAVVTDRDRFGEAGWIAPGGARPSPYPDAPTRVQQSPYPDTPRRSHVDSVFDDIPPPSDLPPRPETAPAPSDPAAAPASEHSVFADAPAATPADPYAPRWVAGHGWVLHPEDPRPLPRNAIWVDGVGHVVPGPPP